MTAKPLVSIIIPTFNRGHLISETLESVLAQTYHNWECIIVDDGSTDNTDEVVEEYLKKDKRFKFYNRPKEHLPGGNGARNYGFKMSKGEYVNWFDSDDLMLPGKVKIQVEILLKNKVDFVSCYGEYFGSINKKIIENKPVANYIVDYFFFGNNYYTPSVIWSVKFLQNKNLFDESLRRGQEYDFHFRMLLQGARLIVINNSLFKIRKGHKSIESSSNSISKLNSMLKVFEKCYEGASKIDFKYKELTLNYLTNRILLVHLSIMCKLSVWQRISYIFLNFKNIYGSLKIRTCFNKHKTTTFLILYSFSKKGYNIIIDHNFRKEKIKNEIMLDLNLS